MKKGGSVLSKKESGDFWDLRGQKNRAKTVRKRLRGRATRIIKGIGDYGTKRGQNQESARRRSKHQGKNMLLRQHERPAKGQKENIEKHAYEKRNHGRPIGDIQKKRD